MKKNARTIIILVVVAAALVGGYFIFSKLWKPEVSLPEGESKQIMTYDVNAANTIKWIYNGVEANLVRNGSEWFSADDTDILLDNTKIATMMTSLLTLTATREITDVSDLSQYGLTEPRAYIEIGLEYGISVSCSIGSMNNTTFEYYASVGGDSSVYTVSQDIYESTFLDFYDLIKADTLAYTTTASRLVLTAPDSGVDLCYSEEGFDEFFYKSYTWALKKDDGALVPANSYFAFTVMNLLNEMEWVKCVDYRYDGSEAERYGFDEPQVSVTEYYVPMNSTSTVKQAIVFGDYTDETENYVYANIEGSKMVFTVTSSSCADLFLLAEEENIRLGTMCKMDWKNEVDSLDISYGSGSYTVALKRGEDGTLGYSLNGAALDAAKAEALMSTLDSLSSDTVDLDARPKGEPLFSAVYSRNTEQFKTVTLNIYSYDSIYYLAEADGEAIFLLSQSSYNKLVAALKDCLPQ